MSLSSCWRSAFRNWFLLIICALVAAGTTFFLTHREQREYRSGVRLAVGPSPTLTDQNRIAAAVDQLNKRTLITTLAEVVGAQTTFGRAKAQLGLPAAEASRYSESSVALPDANVIALAVEGPRRSVAAALVNAVATRSSADVEHFYKNFSVRQLDQPSTPSDPVTPKPQRDVPLAALGGLGFGFFLGLCRDYLRDRRRRHEEQ